jgi:hypothetical protein
VRLSLPVMALLLLAAGVTGCGTKSPAGPNPPPGVVANPSRPDPEAIKRRKPMLTDVQKGGAPATRRGPRPAGGRAR